MDGLGRAVSSPQPVVREAAWLAVRDLAAKHASLFNPVVLDALLPRFLAEWRAAAGFHPTERIGERAAYEAFEQISGESCIAWFVGGQPVLHQDHAFF